MLTLDVMLRAALADYLGWTYAIRPVPAVVAIGIPGLTPDAAIRRPDGARVTDCCTFVAGSLGMAYYPSGDWTDGAFRDLEIRDVRRPWSNVERLHADGFGDAPIEYRMAGPHPDPGAWYVAQAWSGLVGGQVVTEGSGLPPSRGHTWFWRGSAIVEASKSAGKVQWITRDVVEQCRRYAVVRAVRLRELG